jgi:hypothetical protein
MTYVALRIALCFGATGQPFGSGHVTRLPAADGSALGCAGSAGVLALGGAL